MNYFQNQKLVWAVWYLYVSIYLDIILIPFLLNFSFVLQKTQKISTIFPMSSIGVISPIEYMSDLKKFLCETSWRCPWLNLQHTCRTVNSTEWGKKVELREKLRERGMCPQDRPARVSHFPLTFWQPNIDHKRSKPAQPSLQSNGVNRSPITDPVLKKVSPDVFQMAWHLSYKSLLSWAVFKKTGFDFQYSS